MAYKSVYKDIIFVEGYLEHVDNYGNIDYKKHSSHNTQLDNLDDIKNQFVEKAKKLGGNVIIDFKYGQKSTTWLRSFFHLFDDNVNWYATGTVVAIDSDRYNEIVSNINKKNS